jgi:Protein of Unknown function (DUF2784)
MPQVYGALADLVVVVHACYVAFVVCGQLAILVGALRKWKWVRNLAFRLVHLATILVVVLEAWWGIVCPLTKWEEELRERAGQTAAQSDFIARYVHDVLFYDFPPWVFTTAYSLFGAVVVLSLVLVPPKRSPG